MAVSDEIFDIMAEPDRMFMHGFTYSGHPVACAVGHPQHPDHRGRGPADQRRNAGAYLLGQLQANLGDHPNVGNIRGKGLMLMVELVADRATKAKFDPALNYGPALQAATRKRGLIVRASNDGIAIAPPLIISKEEADAVAGAITEAVREVLG